MPTTIFPKISAIPHVCTVCVWRVYINGPSYAAETGRRSGIEGETRRSAHAPLTHPTPGQNWSIAEASWNKCPIYLIKTTILAISYVVAFNNDGMLVWDPDVSKCFCAAFHVHLQTWRPSVCNQWPCAMKKYVYSRKNNNWSAIQWVTES